MNNIIQVCDDYDVRRERRVMDVESRVGRAVLNAYPKTEILVEANLPGGIVTIKVPKISKQYGAVVHLTHNMVVVERRAVQIVGELLERFRVSRTTGDASHVRRNIAGEAIGAREGGQ